MKKDYWKEGCILLVGIIIGFSMPGEIGSSSQKAPITKDTIVIRDTIFAKTVIPPLNKESVLSELNKANIPHSNIVLAQSILETGNYTSKLCKTHNNIFGLRKGKQYRKYDNYIECIADYKRLISSKYKGGSYYNFLTNLGYAEDPNYISILKNMV